MLIGKNRVIRRRALVGLLVAASLTLLTLSYRQGSAGMVGDIQRGALAATAPFSAAAHRVTQPFVDGWNWVSGLAHARETQLRLTHEASLAAVYAARLQAAERQNADFRNLLHFQGQNPSYNGIGASVIGQPWSIYQSHITISAGVAQGVRVGDPVVAPIQNGAGLIGQVDSVAGSTAEVDLLTDPSRSVATRVLGSSARGLLQSSPGTPGLFSLLQVSVTASI
ncbi:MAG TPA: rod shape-determining protein MreC, partial [Gaiellales bacterium]|nr:rod shape-determining protein MreC [Gaiellales bacterium]